MEKQRRVEKYAFELVFCDCLFCEFPEKSGVKLIGELSLKKGSYGSIESSLAVTVKNLTDKQASFSIQIEALDSSGNRITQDYIYANDLGAGQSQNFKVFEYISSDNYEAMKEAKFNIVSVSEY